MWGVGVKIYCMNPLTVLVYQVIYIAFWYPSLVHPPPIQGCIHVFFTLFGQKGHDDTKPSYLIMYHILPPFWNSWCLASQDSNERQRENKDGAPNLLHLRHLQLEKNPNCPFWCPK